MIYPESLTQKTTTSSASCSYQKLNHYRNPHLNYLEHVHRRPGVPSLFFERCG